MARCPSPRAAATGRPPGATPCQTPEWDGEIGTTLQTILQRLDEFVIGQEGVKEALLLALIVLVVSLVGLRIGVTLFDREAILTRWR